MIQTVKVKMYRFYTHKRTYRYVDILQDIVRNYNHRPHRSLNGKSPSEINQSNEATAWQQMYMKNMKPEPKRVKDKVDALKTFQFQKRQQTHVSTKLSTGWQMELYSHAKIIKIGQRSTDLSCTFQDLKMALVSCKETNQLK